MRIVLITSFLVVLAAGATVSGAERTLSLDECIDLALTTRASIIMARGAEDLAAADRRAALGAFLPRVDASYRYAKSLKRDFEAETDVPTEVDTFWVADTAGNLLGFPRVRNSEKMNLQLPDQDATDERLTLSATMSLLDVSNFFDLAAAGAEKARARLDVIASEQDLILSVKVAYYAHLAALENVEVQQDAVERSREQLNLIESMFEVGSAAKSDVLKQRVQLGNDRLTHISARNSVETTRAELAYTIGIDPNSDVAFETEHASRVYVADLDEAIAFGLGHQPDLLSARKSRDAAKHSVRSAWSAYLPTLGGSGNLTWFSGSSGDTVLYDNSQRTLSYGVNVSWNIFDGFWRERQLSSAKIVRNNTLARLSDQRNSVIVGIKTAYLDIEQTILQQEVAGENVAAADEDLRITQEKYNLGAATILDLLTAQVSLKQAQMTLIRAEFDHNLAIARLENAMGKM